jgi:hypothetical protein
MSLSNYGAKQANNTSYIKNFFVGFPTQLWTVGQLTTQNNVNVITPIQGYSNVYIPGTLYVGNSIVTTSDLSLKENITELTNINYDKIMELQPKQFTFINDTEQKKHYGFIAQELENIFPELVVPTIDINDTNNTIKSVNYLELLPLLVSKIQYMQKEIDYLKDTIKNNK